jgi:acetolactate synthase-1/2/3 large subunit
VNFGFDQTDVVLSVGYELEELLPTLQRALADGTLSIIACPVDYTENIGLTDKPGKLTEPI